MQCWKLKNRYCLKKKKSKSWQDGSASEGTCHQAWWPRPELHYQDIRTEGKDRRHKLSSDLCVHHVVYEYEGVCTQTQDKRNKRIFKNISKSMGKMNANTAVKWLQQERDLEPWSKLTNDMRTKGGKLQFKVIHSAGFMKHGQTAKRWKESGSFKR